MRTRFHRTLLDRSIVYRLSPLIAAFVVLGGMAAATRCRPLLLAPARGLPAGVTSEQARTRGLDLFLLTDLFDSDVVVEVDHVEGYAPGGDALATLRQALESSLPPGRELGVTTGQEISRASWDAQRDSLAGRSRIISEHLDADPRDWDRVEVVYVIFGPRQASWLDEDFLGLSGWATLERGGEPARVRFIHIARDRIESSSYLRIDARELERSVIKHEVGHALGLVSNPEHAPVDGSRHCTEPGCVMSVGRRSFVFNMIPGLLTGSLPVSFCQHCRADLASARTAVRMARPHGVDPALYFRAQRFGEEIAQGARWFAERGRHDDGLAYVERRRLPVVLDGVAAYWSAWLLQDAGQPQRALEIVRHLRGTAADEALLRTIEIEALCDLGLRDEARELHETIEDPCVHREP